MQFKKKETAESELSLSLSTIIQRGGMNLSAGQKQILALARASLALDARVVILDEISSNMDPQVAARALEVVKSELLHRNVAVLLIAHSISDILSCDEVLVMESGRIMERGNPRELIQNSAGYFAAMAAENELALY
jgi:ABC-type multidrug transport system fused ATPase/permease subunit